MAQWLQAFQRLSPCVVASESVMSHIYRNVTTSQNLFADRYYTKKHEWVVVEGDTGTVGISDFAQDALGDIVYAELPEAGKYLHIGDTGAAIESVKAASDVYSPISGTVKEKNVELEKNPSLINKSPFDKGWLFKLKVKNAHELKDLMDEAAYEEFKKIEENESGT